MPRQFVKKVTRFPMRRSSSLPMVHEDEKPNKKRLRFSQGSSLVDENVELLQKNERRRSAFFVRSSRYAARNRLLQKNGEFNICLSNVGHTSKRYCSDMWTTLIEVKWRWALLAFSLSFILSWLFFSVIYYCIIYTHGDLDNLGDGWAPCLVNVNSFAGAFMYSLETQTTIGYGYRYPSDSCPEIIYAVCMQSMVGVVIQALMVGVVFARLVRPKNRAETIVFSRNAVIAMRDNKLCFMFRVGDIRKNQLACISLRVFMIRKYITTEGEVLPFYLHEMKCKIGDVDGCPILTWPATVSHCIDSNSPLYNYSASDLTKAKFEIVVILDGVIPANGVSTEARTSYLPREILWGYRLDSLMAYQRNNGEYRIDYNKFHSVHSVWAPVCSARDLKDCVDLGIDPATWYQNVRRRAELIDTPDCTITPTAYAPVRRKITEIFNGTALQRENSEGSVHEDVNLSKLV